MFAVAGLLALKGIPMGAGGIPLFAWIDPALILIAIGCLLSTDPRMLAAGWRIRSSTTAEGAS